MVAGEGCEECNHAVEVLKINDGPCNRFDVPGPECNCVPYVPGTELIGHELGAAHEVMLCEVPPEYIARGWARQQAMAEAYWAKRGDA